MITAYLNCKVILLISTNRPYSCVIYVFYSCNYTYLDAKKNSGELYISKIVQIKSIFCLKLSEWGDIRK